VNTVHDAVIIGGGPAGSTCARVLVRGGARVAIVDRAEFPRVKLCGGWLSPSIWDELALAPREYTGDLWEWSRCHVRFRGYDRTVACRGFFIRRYQLDDFLLRRSGAELHLGVDVDAQAIARDGDGLWSVAGLRARHLIGAAGTHCPVARLHTPVRPMRPVGAQEHEFPADRDAVARTRVGGDGEPELLLHDDLAGYSWNVPKTDWLNVGVGTADPGAVRAAWLAARDYLCAAGHVPAEAAPELEPRAMRGHAYYLFDPAHIDAAARADADQRGGSYLIGDSLGLAQPLTAEGILPAVISARLLAEAILEGAPQSYPARLRAHPVIEDYRRLHGLRQVAAGSARPNSRRAAERPAARSPSRVRSLVARLGRPAAAAGFAWMFSGARLPAPRVIDAALAAGRRWQQRRAAGGAA